MQSRVPIKVLILAAVVGLLLLIQYYMDISAYYSPEGIRRWLIEAGHLAPFLYMTVMALAVATPLPTLPLDIAAGAFFGPIPGTIYSATGALGGAIISFSIARLLGRELIERFLRGHINFCIACSDRLLTGVIFLTRLVPLVSFDLVSYGAGLTKMSLRRFSLATFLGMLPLTFAFNYFGSFLIISQGVAVSLGLAMAPVFFLLPLWVERYAPVSIRRLFQHAEQGTEVNRSE